MKGGVPVRLFGRDTRWPGGAAALAMKTDALILPGGCWRNPDNTYSIMAAPPIRCESTGDRDGDLRRNMQRIVDALEQIIRRHPDQWYMFRRMWPVPGTCSRPPPTLPLSTWWRGSRGMRIAGGEPRRGSVFATLGQILVEEGRPAHPDVAEF